MVSLSEAIAYQEMGEPGGGTAKPQILCRVHTKTYLGTKGLVERLDLIDPSPENYWSKAPLDIEKKILAITFVLKNKNF